jgi:sugar phosphate isomerase/epimerase
MKISIASYAFHGLLEEGKMDIFGYLETCKYRYGLDAADIWNGTLGPAGLDAAHIRKVRQALDEREMTLANFCVDGAHLWEGDPGEREKNYQKALAHLKAAEILGAQTVRIDMGGQGEQLTPEQFDYVVKRYREYAQRAHDHGYRVGPETHWGPSLTVEVQDAVRKAVNHPGYGILLHIGHWNGGAVREDEGDRRLAPWAFHTHVDARIAATCLEEKMKILREAGYSGYWGIEHHSAKNEYAEVAWQVALVQRQLVRFNPPA